MLLRFVLEEPRRRYAILEPFLNLDRYQLVEDNLKGLSDQIETKRAGLRRQRKKLKPGCARLLRNQTMPLKRRSCSTIECDLKQLGLKSCSDLSQVEERQNEIAAEIGSPEINERIGLISNLQHQAQQLGRATTSPNWLIALAIALEDYERQIADRSEEVITDFLIRGKDIIAGRVADVCPLCEQAIERTQLFASRREN